MSHLPIPQIIYFYFSFTHGCRVGSTGKHCILIFNLGICFHILITYNKEIFNCILLFRDISTIQKTLIIEQFIFNFPILELKKFISTVTISLKHMAKILKNGCLKFIS